MHTRKALGFLSLLLFSLLVFTPRSSAQETNFDWPREIDSPIGQIIMYEPQPDSLDGDLITGRAAVSLHRTGEEEPVFGALWFRVQVAVDRDAGTVTFINMKVLRVRFPDADADETQKFTDAVETEVPQWELVLSLDQLEAGLAASQQEAASTENLKSDPPQIIFSQTPAVLVSYDGDPELRAIQNSPYQRVVNTAFLIIKDKSGNYYLSNGQIWYSSTNPTGTWKELKNPPEDIEKLVPPDKDEAPAEPGPAPRIITATTPTELIVTDGAPKWTPLTGNELLYVSNTETTWIKEIATNKHYLLLSGRWFSSPSLDGPWTYERGDQLPSSFKRIAPASPIGDALAAVPGTNQAEDAVMDSEIPQTAAIKRSEAKTEVSYDGDPQFQPIPSTDIQYAVNTDASVLKIGDRYYVCDNAVWFAGLTPTGPWVVADSVPDSVKSIPPSSPVYNVRYVQVYDSTPDIVYVGYTPGYIGTYRYYGTVVYGTGWVYRPWIGPVYYYPRPFTWGFSVVYNPWTGGWGYALGYSTSFINISIGWGNRYYRRPSYWNGGWWGPGGYRPVYRPRPGYRPPHYRPPSNVRPIRPGRPGRPGINPPGGRPRPTPRDNIYAQPVNRDRVTRDVPKGGRVPKPARNTRDNVYTDKDGNVYRRDNKGNWQQRDKNGWKPTTPPAGVPAKPEKPGTTRPSPRPAKPGTNPPTTQPVKPEKPGTTRPSRPTKPQPEPGAPSTQPVKPEKPGTTRPSPRPTKPQPGTPTTQPAKPEKPGTARPSRPVKPQPEPGAPSTQPVKPTPARPQPKPTPPAAQPPKPDRPATTRPSRPAKPQPDDKGGPSAQPTKPASTRPQQRPAQPSAKPATKPAPASRPQKQQPKQDKQQDGDSTPKKN